MLFFKVTYVFYSSMSYIFDNQEDYKLYDFLYVQKFCVYFCVLLTCLISPRFMWIKQKLCFFIFCIFPKRFNIQLNKFPRWWLKSKICVLCITFSYWRQFSRMYISNNFIQSWNSSLFKNNHVISVNTESLSPTLD